MVDYAMHTWGLISSFSYMHNSHVQLSIWGPVAVLAFDSDGFSIAPGGESASLIRLSANNPYVDVVYVCA